MLRKIAILILLAFGFNLVVLTVVWIHHNMVTGLNPFLAPIFALLQLVLLAGCVWVGGRYLLGHLRKYIDFSPSTLFVLAAVIMATTLMVDNTRFYVQLLFAVLFLVLAGAYRFFPVVAHRTLNPTLGYIHFWISLVCAYLLAYPHHVHLFPHTTALILLAAQGIFLVNLFNSTANPAPHTPPSHSHGSAHHL